MNVPARVKGASRRYAIELARPLTRLHLKPAAAHMPQLRNTTGPACPFGENFPY